MAQLAVFDRFYAPGPDNPEPIDIVGMALALGEHEVVAHANTIRGGALAIAAMSEGEIETPDVVIVGGRLEDDSTYLEYPATITRIAEVTGRTLLRKPKIVTRQITTTLLPLPENEGSMVLPTSYKSPIKPRRVAELTSSLNYRLMAPGRAAYVLSHLARVMLPKDLKIIGISSLNTMQGLPVDMTLDRGGIDRIAAAEDLRQAIVNCQRFD